MNVNLALTWWCTHNGMQMSAATEIMDLVMAIETLCLRIHVENAIAAAALLGSHQFCAELYRSDR